MNILFVTKKKFNLVSWIIKKYMRAEYSHVAVTINIYDNEMVIESTGIKDTRMVTLESFLEKNTVIESVECNKKNDKLKIINYLLKQLGKQYSYKSLIGILLGIDSWGNDGAGGFICTELIARALGIEDDNLDQINLNELMEYLKE